MVSINLNRREFLTTAAQLAGAMSVASTFPSTSELQAGPHLYNPSNPLSGVIRSPVNYLPVSQRFPAPLNFSSSRPIFPSPGFFYGGFRSSFYSPYYLPYPYLNLRNRANNRTPSNPYRNNPPKANQGSRTPNPNTAPEPKFTYPITKTPQEQAVLEALYKDTANTLARDFGYAENFKNGKAINQPDQLLHYLTPIVFAHDTFNQDTLDTIGQGLKNGNEQLRNTYGSAQFFQDAIKAIEFNKIKSEARELLKKKNEQAPVPETKETVSDPAIADLNRIIKELKSIETKVQVRLTNFKIDRLEENAAFIVRAYHRFNDKQLTMIADGLAKAVDKNKAKDVTLEQRLYVEQFTVTKAREMAVGQALFLLAISTLNDLHSDDKDSNGNKSPVKKIPDLIKQAAAYNDTGNSSSRFIANHESNGSGTRLMTRLGNPELTETDKLKERFWASITA